MSLKPRPRDEIEKEEKAKQQYEMAERTETDITEGNEIVRDRVTEIDVDDEGFSKFHFFFLMMASFSLVLVTNWSYGVGNKGDYDGVRNIESGLGY